MKRPATWELFTAFLGVSVRAFGGVLPWARRMLVEEKQWLNEKEFADTLAICQVLPGPNIVNVSIVVGSRKRGRAGAAAAFLGLILVPMFVVIGIGALYDRFGQWTSLHDALGGTTAAAAGLILAMAAKIARPCFRARPLSAVVAGAAFLGAGVLGFPLLWVLGVLAPLSLLLSWRRWL